MRATIPRGDDPRSSEQDSLQSREDYLVIVAAAKTGWRRRALEAAGVCLVVLASAWYVDLLNLARLRDGVWDFIDLFGNMLPPDFGGVGGWIMPVFDTLAMSVAGTAIAVIFSLPIALMASKTTAPHPIIYQAGRTTLNALRAVPELIMAIIFVAAVGFGALPGVLALGIHSIGMVGKFYAESIEHASQAPIEAAKAAGASTPQVVLHGILPQVLPQMADVSIYRWEYNFRASTVIGIVGAGGIGFELVAALRTLQYQQVSAILLLILATVSLVDGLSGMLRRRFG